jgi:hypothetical protein
MKAGVLKCERLTEYVVFKGLIKVEKIVEVVMVGISSFLIRAVEVTLRVTNVLKGLMFVLETYWMTNQFLSQIRL